MTTLPQKILQTIASFAEKAYPSECCGLVLQSRDQPEDWRVWPVRNIQDDMHRRLPEEFPRTAQNAYWMDPLELLGAHKALHEKNERIAVIYHSHPDAEAFFSAEDERLALDDRGQPLYPEAVYWVLSVRQGKAGEGRYFFWNAARRKFQS